MHLADRNRSFENGENLFRVAQCAACHKIKKEGGVLGPELTHIANAFSKRGPEPRVQLVQSILHPSRDIADRYRVVILDTDDGKQVSGIVIENDTQGFRLANNPAQSEATIFIPRDAVESIEQTEISLMPSGLLSTLTLDDIMDLVAYIETGGDASQSVFQREAADKASKN